MATSCSGRDPLKCRNLPKRGQTPNGIGDKPLRNVADWRVVIEIGRARRGSPATVLDDVSSDGVDHLAGDQGVEWLPSRPGAVLVATCVG